MLLILTDTDIMINKRDQIYEYVYTVEFHLVSLRISFTLFAYSGLSLKARKISLASLLFSNPKADSPRYQVTSE